MKKRALLVFVALLLPCDASAFSHVVSQGETLAQLAIKLYGTPPSPP